VANLGIDNQLGRFAELEIRGITCDSREVSNDFMFVAIEGYKTDGRLFIGEAIERGARVIVSKDRQLPSGQRDVCFLSVPDDRKALAVIASNFYNNPSRKLKLIGITGTDGKTTTAYLIENILSRAGFKTGVIGTIEYRYNNIRLEADNTTPGVLKMQSLLSDMLKANVKYAVVEVSSHALQQSRVEGMLFSHAVFTNFASEHLDYHKTLDDYFRAKAKLFQHLSSGSVAIINKDSPYAQRLLNLCNAEILTYGIDMPADISADNIILNENGSRFTMNIRGEDIKIQTGLIGRHNIYNILAAAGVAVSEGLDLNLIAEAVASVDSVPGRLEFINCGQDFCVFVDYAHTENALSNILRSLRQITKGRIITVFGCGGSRDRTKRPRMGYVATELSDFCFITSDNPRDEDPQRIINEILSGVSRFNFKIIPDRKQAIYEAIELARPQDTVLIAGKGHEAYQIYKNTKIYFNDKEIARECLRHLLSRK